MEIVDKLRRYEEIFSNNNYYGVTDDKKVNVLSNSFGNTKILISAPHATKQIRDNLIKTQEFYTGSMAILLAQRLNAQVVTKYKTDLKTLKNDDPNYEENCLYKDLILKTIKDKDIKLFIDLHGMNSKKLTAIDINTNLKKNINNTNLDIYFQKSLEKFLGKDTISIDKYFTVSNDYILSNFVNNKTSIPAIQLEINGKYRMFECDGKYLEDSVLLYRSLFYTLNILKNKL